MPILLRIGLTALFGTIGLFFGWATVRALRYRHRWLREAAVLPGRVVAIKERSHQAADESEVYSPVVSFSTPEGEKTFTSATARNPCPYEVGQEVMVRYLPGESHPAKLDSDVRSVTFHLAIAALALAALGAAVASALLPY